MKKIGIKLVKVLYSLSVVMAVFAVNNTCVSHFYQEKLDKQLDSLRRY